jgi:putative transposase
MPAALSLRTSQRKKLLHYYRSHPDPSVRSRAHIILLLADGHPWTSIQAMLYCSSRPIDRWRERFENGGIDALLGRSPGSKPRWSEEAEAALRKALEHSPHELGYLAVNWSVPLLRKHVEKEWGQMPSDLQIRQELQRLNYVWKRPGLDLRGAKSPRVRRRLRLIRKKVRALPAGCAKLFEDETDLHLFPPLRAGWFQRGKPAKVPISGWNAKRTVYGTIDVETGRRTFVVRTGICAPDFHETLRSIRQAYGDRKVVLLLDKASRHTAHASANLATELDIGLIWLPQRTTNVNPMDRLWRWGKDNICANRQHPDIDSQANLFVEYLLSLSPQEALRKAGMLSGRFWLYRGVPGNSGLCLPACL